MKTLSVLFLIALSFVTFIYAAHAQQNKEFYPIGQLVALEGKAFYTAGGKKTEMKLDDPVFLNTVVETGPETKALILFVDNTQITLGENSELVIDNFVFDPYDPEENKGAFEMTKGPFLWVSGLISKRKEPQVDIKTRVGSIGIRGTKFWGGNIDDENYGVYVFNGLVNFAGEAGNTDIPMDSGVIIGEGKKEFNSQAWPHKQLQNSIMSVTFGKQIDVDKQVAQRMTENIAKQHDYRARMFPFKENPFEPRLKSKNDKFFTDEFEKMKDKQ